MTVVASNFDRKPSDLYETERFATLALIRAFPQIFWRGEGDLGMRSRSPQDG